MQKFTKDQIYRDILHALDNRFNGYWILIGKTERGMLVKKAFDPNREFMLYSKNLPYFRYHLLDSDYLLPATEEDAKFVNDYFASHPDDISAFELSTQAYEQY